jgi:hypothetical protein
MTWFIPVLNFCVSTDCTYVPNLKMHLIYRSTNDLVGFGIGFSCFNFLHICSCTVVSLIAAIHQHC